MPLRVLFVPNNQPNKKIPREGSKARTGDRSLYGGISAAECVGRERGSARRRIGVITLCRYCPECL